MFILSITAWNSLPDSSCSGGSPFQWYVYNVYHFHLFAAWLLLENKASFIMIVSKSSPLSFVFIVELFSIHLERNRLMAAPSFIFTFNFVRESFVTFIYETWKRNEENGKREASTHNSVWCKNNSTWEFHLNAR